MRNGCGARPRLPSVVECKWPPQACLQMCSSLNLERCDTILLPLEVWFPLTHLCHLSDLLPSPPVSMMSSCCQCPHQLCSEWVCFWCG